MSLIPTRREDPRQANFHDNSARQAYAPRFRDIGIAAVAAGARRSAVPKAISPRDIPAILRNGFDD
jgi:hypothetical protein